ncbi:hypothetical protein BD310DRAFT_1026335 [Dichomitus squalens]|uniref:Uncharacterized protein n=1 Tax=Dichomitus squalens TaxID=114155 RepID=A0A4Q9PP93_9APHY|nr:hypothetical protein BD310DRAFT_1026335 [Dichomitus squalens]
MHEEGSDPVNGKLQWFELDVEASSKIKDVAAAFLEEEGRPNVLGEMMDTVAQCITLGDMLICRCERTYLTKVVKGCEHPMCWAREVCPSDTDDWNKEYTSAKNPIVGAKKDDQLRC